MRHDFSFGDELRFGWRKTLDNLKSWLWLGGMGAFLSLLSNAVSRSRTPLGPLLILGIQLLQAGLTLATFRLALRIADGKPIGELDPKALLVGYFPFLFTQLLVAMIVVGGLILLIVPGLIWAARYGFAPLLCADGAFDPIEALHESHQLTAGRARSLVLFGLGCVAVNLAGALALGIGLFVTIPTTITAMAHLLRRLQALHTTTHGVTKGVPMHE